MLFRCRAHPGLLLSQSCDSKGEANRRRQPARQGPCPREGFGLPESLALARTHLLEAALSWSAARREASTAEPRPAAVSAVVTATAAAM